MSRFPSVTGFQLIKALRKLGFEVIRTKGSHNFDLGDEQKKVVIDKEGGTMPWL